jgi:dGTPase
VEAADDISYSIADLEDGFRRKRVSYDDVYNLLTPFIWAENSWWKEHLDPMRHLTEKVEFLRALAIGGLVHSAVDCFMQNEAALLAGTHLDKGLTRHMALAAPFATLGTVNFDKVYQDPQVVEIEAAGFEVMDTLLSSFGGAVFRQHTGKATARDRTLLKLLPESRHAAEESLYEKMLEVTDFVSGMTDTSAVTMYKKLSGVTLAKG